MIARRQNFVPGACILAVITFVPLVSFAQQQFTATLTGAAERPTPTASQATGQATGELTGGPGAWVFTYEVIYSALEGGPALAGHIHDTLEPDGATPTEQFGPVIHPLDELDSPINGDWRFDDATNPLTDEFAGKLQAGELYFNLHNAEFEAGEIRGQILPVAAVIPLPAPVAIAGVGLMGVVASHLRRRRSAL